MIISSETTGHVRPSGTKLNRSDVCEVLDPREHAWSTWVILGSDCMKLQVQNDLIVSRNDVFEVPTSVTLIVWILID